VRVVPRQRRSRGREGAPPCSAIPCVVLSWPSCSLVAWPAPMVPSARMGPEAHRLRVGAPVWGGTAHRAGRRDGAAGCGVGGEQRRGRGEGGGGRGGKGGNPGHGRQRRRGGAFGEYRRDRHG